jgi:hypothetical protein
MAVDTFVAYVGMCSDVAHAEAAGAGQATAGS